MKLLVLGASGQVARHLRTIRPDALFWGRATLDMTDIALLEEAILETVPSVIINAAAYTAVDDAESEAALAWRLNAEAPAAAARAAESLEIPLVHFSTDYVFDGAAEKDYSTADKTNPINVYGRSKLGGELAVSSISSRHWIIRTSWVFSEYEPNFLCKILRLGHSQKVLRIVDDQFGRPTFAGHLAEFTHRLLTKHEHNNGLPYGTYHAVGGRVASRFEFAQCIFDRAAHHGLIAQLPELVRIETENYPTAAQRPLRTVLEPSTELQALADGLFDWQQGLDHVLARLRGDRSGCITQDGPTRAL